MALTALHPARDAIANLMTPPARLVEPRLAASTHCGAVLLLERGNVHLVSEGILEVVDAWDAGRTLLRQSCIVLPLQPIPDRLVARLGERYRDGSCLRMTAPAPPPVFAPSGDVMDAQAVHAGSLVECAVTFSPEVSDRAQRVVRALLQWVEVRIALPANKRWGTL